MSDIRQVVVSHFTKIFKEQDIDRPHIDGVVFFFFRIEAYTGCVGLGLA